MTSQELSEGFVGREKLVGLMGRWPTFHDAEVFAIELQRDEGRPLTSPHCRVELSPCFLESGTPTQETSPLISLRFMDICDFELAKFNHQNPILGLRIVPSDLSAKEHPLSSHVYDVVLEPVSEGAFGAAFTCSRVEVVAVTRRDA